MKTVELLAAVERAVELGLAAAAVVDAFGNTLAVAGALAADEVRPIVGEVTRDLNSEGVVRRMYCGEMVEASVDDRTVAVGIAARFAFVVVVFAAVTKSSRALASALRREIGRVLDETQTDLAGAPPWTRDGGDSSSGPANLPVIEFGITVPRRERAKA